MAETTTCPICDGEVGSDDRTLVGELLDCPDCGGELVVNTIGPLAVEEAPVAAEDWGE